jgi:hypothetical protein
MRTAVASLLRLDNTMIGVRRPLESRPSIHLHDSVWQRDLEELAAKRLKPERLDPLKRANPT